MELEEKVTVRDSCFWGVDEEEGVFLDMFFIIVLIGHVTECFSFLNKKKIIILGNSGLKGPRIGACRVGWVQKDRERLLRPL